MKRRSVKRILVDARTPVHYTMVAPAREAMRDDARVRFSFIASDSPSEAARIFCDAGPDADLVGPAQAALTRFDAYLTSDFTWTTLLHRPRRIQMFHGVGGKYGFDAPTESLRAWDRLLFVNRRRLANCVAAGAIDADSPAIRLVGMPKVDCLVDGSLQRDAVLASLGLPPDRPAVLYAPTWSPASSLNSVGLDLVRRMRALPVSVIVKLHDRSRDLRARYSGGVDWSAALAPLLSPGRVVLAAEADICRYLAAADVLVTDHSSAGFEYLLLDRPIVRIHVPELIALANIHADYVALLAEVSESTRAVDDTIAAIERALAEPQAKAAARRLVAADLFHDPGNATRRCTEALYEAIDLEPAERSRGRVRSTVAPGTLAPGTLAPGTPAPGTLAPGTPAVSVIMPAFNAASYLRGAAESALRQTYGDLELIIIDDGSTDDTVQVAQMLAARDRRVRVLSQPNAGPGPARTAGFRVASGQVFAFLDSDDEWDPTFLESQMAVLDARPDIDVVVGNARHRGGSRHGQPVRPIRHGGLPITLAEILADETALFIMTVFRRAAVDAVGGFDPDIFTNEEYEMWIRAAAAGFSFTRNPAPLGWYTNRDGSLSSSETRMLRGILQVFDKTRALVPPRSPERAILERQVVRFSAELAAAEMRESLRRGDAHAAAGHLARLQAQRGGWWLAAVARFAQRAPFALAAAFHMREKLRGTA